jgi:hypothetical protein
MSAGTYDITIEQGADLSLPVTITMTGVDFSGYTARAKVRNTFETGGAAVVSFTVTNGAQSVGSYALTLSLTAAQTAALTANASGRLYVIGYWDLEILTGSVVTRVLQGKATLAMEATV